MKSKSKEDHPQDLEETFNNLRKFGIKLKLDKCVFGVREGKFLGYIITLDGIKSNPTKIQAIRELEIPKNLKDLQSMNGKIAALHRFIPRSTDECKDFFKLIRKHKGKIEWNKECSNALDNIKKELSELLQTPQKGETLFLYIAVSDSAVSSVLVTEREKIQKPVFYFSKKLQGAENTYPPLERLALAVVMSARRLKPYFQAHSTVIPTRYPLLQTLHRPNISGRMSK